MKTEEPDSPCVCEERVAFAVRKSTYKGARLEWHCPVHGDAAWDDRRVENHYSSPIRALPRPPQRRNIAPSAY